MHEEQTIHLLPLLIVSLLAFLVPLILKRIRGLKIPNAVGEIMAGMLVGKSGLNLVNPDSTLQLLNFLGLVSLMFVSGLEIDFKLLTGKAKSTGSQSWRDRASHPLVMASAFLVVTLGGAWYFAEILEAKGFVKSAPLLALIMGTAALSMAVPVLKESNLMQTRFGQTLLAGTVVGDFVTMVALTIGVSLYAGGFSLQTMLVLGLLAVLIVAYRAGRALRKFDLLGGLGGGTAQIGVRASFATMLVFVALAQALEVEVVLGAFLGGVLVSLLSGRARDEISHKLDALGFGFLIPIFFIMVGVTFDFRVLLADQKALLFVPLLLGVTLLVRGLPPALLLAPFYPLRQALAGGALMAAQMSVTIAASSVVLRAGAISESIHSAIVLVVILLAILAPIAFAKLMPPVAVEQPILMIAGANAMGLRISRSLRTQWPTVLIDADPAKVEQAEQVAMEALQGDATDLQVLLDAVKDRPVQAFVAVTGRDDLNISAAVAARDQLGVETVVALVQDAERYETARAQGITAVNPELASLSLIESLLTNPESVQLLHGAEEEIVLFDVELQNPAFAGQRLREVRLPAGALVAAVHRQNQKLIPHGDTQLEIGDVLTLVSPRENREDLLLRLG